MKGIIVAGSTLVDKIYSIPHYPTAGELSPVSGYSQSVGGCVPNVALDLKALCPDLAVFACGRVGKDADGDYVKQRLASSGVDVGGMKDDTRHGTSFTLVMSVEGGERTFFTYNGANAHFGAEDVDFKAFGAKMLHLGYFLLLDKMDGGDGLLLLKKAKENGIRTSVDLVSRDNVSYQGVLPLLPYVDNLIINEIEASRLLGMEKESDAGEMAALLKKRGVAERVIIHKPEVAVCASDRGVTRLPSYDLPQGFIKGTTGAGDAFCAGALVGIYNGMDDLSLLQFASSVAVASLRSADAVGGLCTAEEVKAVCKDLKRKG